jgi:hypothetical protein
MAAVVPLQFRSHLPSVNLALASSAASPQAKDDKTEAVDLRGQRKVWFLIGRGRIGKTTLARWIAETAEDRGAGFIVAAVDPVNRSLRNYIDGVAEPSSADPAEVRDWLWGFLQHVQAEKLNALVDLGGGDTALSALLHDMPDLAEIMAGAGTEAVAVHIVGPDQHDLSPLALAESQGFRPRATVIVLNEAHGRREKFQPILEHQIFRSAMARGAIQLWMPLLTPDAARTVDANEWQYRNVKNAGGPFTASLVHNWLRRMEEAFSPVSSWFPEA